jgi:hypothetical protein
MQLTTQPWLELTPAQPSRASLAQAAAEHLGAVPDELIPGIWHLDGYPELTTGQLLDVAARS